jgi:hypothetical protein
MVLCRPEIYELLVSKGAGLDKVNITELYAVAPKQIQQLAACAGLCDIQKEETEGATRLRSNSFYKPPETSKGALNIALRKKSLKDRVAPIVDYDAANILISHPSSRFFFLL